MPQTPPARKKLIAALDDSDSSVDHALYNEFQAELRRASGWSFLLRESGRYPHTGRGDINTYSVFAEIAVRLSGHAVAVASFFRPA